MTSAVDELRVEITALLDRYVEAVDGQDAALLRTCFADDVVIDNAGNPTLEISGDEWVAQALRGLAVFSGTQHSISEIDVEATSSGARCTAKVLARHDNADATLCVHGSYTHELVKIDAGWRIQHFMLAVDHVESETKQASG